MIVKELICTAIAHKIVVHDDVLTREMVEQYVGFSCALTTARGIEFVGALQGGGASHSYPMVAQDRIVPLLKLLVQLRIPFVSVRPLPDIPQPWRDAKTTTTTRPLLTREQEAKRREEAKLAAAKRVLAYKARQAASAPAGIDPNDALSAAEDREPDVW